MSKRYVQLYESQEKQASLEQFLTGLYDKGDDEKHKRMKKLMYAGFHKELTDRQKNCIKMKYVDCMSAEEIAQELDLSAATVYKHIRTGIKRLKKLVCYL